MAAPAGADPAKCPGQSTNPAAASGTSAAPGAAWDTALQHNTVAGTPCANCGSIVLNRYCGACGQRLEHSVHSVSHFTREATEDLTHADSRLWRTLAALLFKPGLLTSEYLAGRRARYLPPFRLYLILSVLFFLGATSSQNTWPVVQSIIVWLYLP